MSTDSIGLRLKHLDMTKRGLAGELGLAHSTVYAWDDLPAYVDAYLRSLEEIKNIKAKAKLFAEGL